MSDKEKLSQEERLLLLEERYNLLYKYCQEIRGTQGKIMNGLSKILEQNKNNTQEAGKWSNTVEERFSNVFFQMANMGIVLEALFPMEEMTEEQKEKINKKAEEIKAKLEQEKKSEDKKVK